MSDKGILFTDGMALDVWQSASGQGWRGHTLNTEKRTPWLGHEQERVERLRDRYEYGLQ